MKELVMQCQVTEGNLACCCQARLGEGGGLSKL